MKIYLPLDSAAVALGADEIAHAIEKHAHAKGVAVTLVRNGSRGMVWLEPMVEVEGPKGRLAFGPMTLADVPALFGDLSAHPKALGLTEDRYVAGDPGVTAGRVVGKAFGGVAQVYAKPTVMFGNERPGDWSLEIGFKVLGF